MFLPFPGLGDGEDDDDEEGEGEGTRGMEVLGREGLTVPEEGGEDTMF